MKDIIDTPDPQQSQRLLKSFFQIADIMNTKQLNYTSRLDGVLRIVLDYLGAEQGSLMVLERNRLIVCAATRSELVGCEQKLDEEESVASWVAKNACPLFIRDISADARFPEREGAYKKNSLLSAPIVHEDQVIGVINATDKCGNKDWFKEDLTYLLYFSSFILWSFVQQKLHTKLTKQRNTLKKRNRELRRQEEMRDQLSRMLIHDLKAPLSEVVANLDILSYSVTDSQKEFLEGAQTACDRAVRMVANLVTIDKISDGKLQLLHEEADVRDLIGEVVSSVKGLARLKGIRFVERIPEQYPMLSLDRTLILRVLQNLLTNSLSYSQSESTIVIGCHKLPGKKKIEFFVQDEGPGIPPDQRETIFDKYARLSEKQDALVGTGLGLHFCKLAVELHRGRIGVTAAEGRGSRFYFTLPIK